MGYKKPNSPRRLFFHHARALLSAVRGLVELRCGGSILLMRKRGGASPGHSVTHDIGERRSSLPMVAVPQLHINAAQISDTGTTSWALKTAKSYRHRSPSRPMISLRMITSSSLDSNVRSGLLRKNRLSAHRPSTMSRVMRPVLRSHPTMEPDGTIRTPLENSSHWRTHVLSLDTHRTQ